MKQVLPIGYEDIKRVIDSDLYYVDKTMMIKELLDTKAQVNLFTRPRRFGKTMALSMVRRFFEDEYTMNGEKIDNSYLFSHLQIAQCGKEYLCHQQRYPVINISLKSAKQPDFEMARSALIKEIQSEYRRHYYLMESGMLLDIDKQRYRNIFEGNAAPVDYATALVFLSQCLATHHGKNVIVLIDEYDVPLENAYTSGFYDSMIMFIRSLFESVLKTNPCLEFAVITGCLRISRESIFTGLNNIKIYSILNPYFDSSFGFTQDEVARTLAYYNLEHKLPEIQEWYDGYLFGHTDIYNPWSIINYIDMARFDSDAFPRSYWSNTSANSIIRELVNEADFTTRQEIEQLLDGGVLDKPVHEDITYEDIHQSSDNLWNFLFFTGYLKKTEEYQKDEQIYIKLAIPNKEIQSIYKQTILTWFNQKVQGADTSVLIKAIEDGNCDSIASFLSEELLETISFFDYAENYYHGFLSGLLKASQKYMIYSNRESGLGRSDIIMKAPSVRGQAIILELKVARQYKQMETCCQKALQQIEHMAYDDALKNEGYTNIKKYGICFFHKECLVMKA